MDGSDINYKMVFFATKKVDNYGVYWVLVLNGVILRKFSFRSDSEVINHIDRVSDYAPRKYQTVQ